MGDLSIVLSGSPPRESLGDSWVLRSDTPKRFLRNTRRALTWQFMCIPAEPWRWGQLKRVPRLAAPWLETLPAERTLLEPFVIDPLMILAENHEFLGRLHPMGRTGTIRDVAEQVVYLQSAAFVTGDILNVDGSAPGGHW